MSAAMPALPRLHTYFRSSAAYRVRIALNLKGIAYEPVIWQLAQGEHLSERYRELAGFGLVPLLEIDGLRLQQSSAIIEYLEERYPDVPLLPRDAGERARARALAQLIACEIHPLNNLRVLKYLRGPLALDETAVNTWYRHWCTEAFAVLEPALARDAMGRYAVGDAPGLVDCLLVPQVFNAQRFEVDMRAYPRINAVVQACLQLKPFDDASPARQPDTPSA